MRGARERRLATRPVARLVTRLVRAAAGVALLGAAWRLPAQPSAAAGLYAGYMRGTTTLTSTRASIPEQSAMLSAFVLGHTGRVGLGVELRHTRFGDRVREAPAAGPPTIESPLTLGLRASLTEASVSYRPERLRLGPLQPAVHAGLLYAQLVDTYQTDTPEDALTTRQVGASLAAGLEVLLGRRATLIARGTRWLLRDEGGVQPGGRPVYAFRFRQAWEVGARIGF